MTGQLLVVSLPPAGVVEHVVEPRLDGGQVQACVTVNVTETGTGGKHGSISE